VITLVKQASAVVLDVPSEEIGQSLKFPWQQNAQTNPASAGSPEAAAKVAVQN
jgi:hypothetical protein